MKDTKRREDTWMRVEMYKEDIVVVDIGYAHEKDTRCRADQICALGIGKKNFTFGPSMGRYRIHVLIPPKKVKKILEMLPISDKKTWYGATHSYLEARNV